MDAKGYATNLYRLEGYKDRLAHRSRHTSLLHPPELAAYEEGVAQAEREMGFMPMVDISLRFLQRST